MNDSAPARATPEPELSAPLAPMPRELTVRGLVLGSVLGVLFAASSVYLSVKVGLTVSASIPVAVLSIALFRVAGRSSVLENCMVQTTGSAGESLAFGAATALPALLLMGYDLSFGHMLLVALLGGLLGVLLMIPLRHGLVVQEHATLTFPEGTACAEVLVAGDRGGTTARLVVSGFLIGAVYKTLYAALKLWRETVGGLLGSVQRLPDGNVVRHGFPGASVSMEVSPELLGVGYIIGPRIAGITFAGGVLSYLLFIPLIHFFGDGLSTPLLSPDGALIRDMGPDEVHRTYVLYIGAGAVATGGLISLFRSMPAIVRAFRRSVRTFLDARRGQSVQVPRTEQDLPITVVAGGTVLLFLAVWLGAALARQPVLGGAGDGGGVLLRHRLGAHHRGDRQLVEPHLRHDGGHAALDLPPVPAARVDVPGGPLHGADHRGHRRHGGEQRRHDRAGPQDGVHRRGDAEPAADRHPRRRGHLGAVRGPGARGGEPRRDRDGARGPSGRPGHAPQRGARGAAGVPLPAEPWGALRVEPSPARSCSSSCGAVAWRSDWMATALRSRSARSGQDLDRPGARRGGGPGPGGAPR